MTAGNSDRANPVNHRTKIAVPRNNMILSTLGANYAAQDLRFIKQYPG
jgi:hypothetical protein